MKMKIGLVLVMLTSLVGSVNAFDWFDGRLSIGGGYGRAKPKLPNAFQDTYQDGAMWTGNIKYFLNNDFSVVASYADLEPYARGNNQDFYRFRPLVGSLRYNLFHHLPISPYLTAGAGYAWNEREAPGIVAQTWNAFTFQAGIGFEFFITEGTSLGAEALYHNFVGQSGIEPYRLASLVGTASIYFGPGPSQRRTQEALKRQQEETQKAQAEANALAQQNQAQQAQSAQQQAQAAAAAAAAQAEAQRKADELKNQVAQAQSEIDQIKAMVARKDISPINFQTGSAELLVDSHGTLDKVADTAKKYPNLKLRVEGHTDSTGSAALNQTLSQKRADAVRDYLVNSAGVSADQITAVGFGQTRPIASNDTAEGRAKNRRVEFVFFLP